jgi:hypothetical protein
MIFKLIRGCGLSFILKMLFVEFPAEPPWPLNPDLALCFDGSLGCNEITASICFLAAGLVSYSDLDNQSILPASQVSFSFPTYMEFLIF